MWAQVRSLGDDLDRNLPGDIRNHPVKLAVVRGDVLTIVWWAKAMHRPRRSSWRCVPSSATATPTRSPPIARSAEARPLRHGADGRRRRDPGALRHPWDFLAMDAAASRRGVLEAAIVTTRFAAAYAEAAIARAEPRRRGDGARCARGVGAPQRHRGSRLDRGGARRLRPPRHQPAERQAVRRRQASARPTPRCGRSSPSSFPNTPPGSATAGCAPRVMFFAHGGLVDERDGLRRGAGPPALLGDERDLSRLLRLGDRHPRDAVRRHSSAGGSSRAATRRADRRRHRSAGADGRQADVGADEEERRERRQGQWRPAPRRRARRRAVALARAARSSSMPPATAPARSSIRISCRCWCRSRPAARPPSASLAPAARARHHRRAVQDPAPAARRFRQAHLVAHHLTR